MTESKPHVPPPIGIIAADSAFALTLAGPLVARGHRVLLHGPASGFPGKLSGGLERVATPTDIAFECSLVVAAVDDTDHLRGLLLGSSERAGLGSELQPGSILIDLGIRPPRETQSFLGVVGMRGVSVVDAAIIGSAEAIAAGGAVVMAGGFPDAVDAAVDVLGTFGTVQRTGPLGSAHTAAALTGYMEAARLTAREEALAVGRAFGVVPEMLHRIVDGAAAPASATVRYLERGSALTRRLASESGAQADVIDFARAKLARSGEDTR